MYIWCQISWNSINLFVLLTQFLMHSASNCFYIWYAVHISRFSIYSIHQFALRGTKKGTTTPEIDLVGKMDSGFRRDCWKSHLTWSTKIFFVAELSWFASCLFWAIFLPLVEIHDSHWIFIDYYMWKSVSDSRTSDRICFESYIREILMLKWIGLLYIKAKKCSSFPQIF